MNRHEKQMLIVESMETWDYSVLLNWAKDTMKMILNELSDEDINTEYNILCEEDLN